MAACCTGVPLKSCRQQQGDVHLKVVIVDEQALLQMSEISRYPDLESVDVEHQSYNHVTQPDKCRTIVFKPCCFSWSSFPRGFVIKYLWSSFSSKLSHSHLKVEKHECKFSTAKRGRAIADPFPRDPLRICLIQGGIPRKQSFDLQAKGSGRRNNLLIVDETHCHCSHHYRLQTYMLLLYERDP